MELGCEFGFLLLTTIGLIELKKFKEIQNAKVYTIFALNAYIYLTWIFFVSNFPMKTSVYNIENFYEYLVNHSEVFNAIAVLAIMLFVVNLCTCILTLFKVRRNYIKSFFLCLVIASQVILYYLICKDLQMTTIAYNEIYFSYSLAGVFLAINVVLGAILSLIFNKIYSKILSPKVKFI